MSTWLHALLYFAGSGGTGIVFCRSQVVHTGLLCIYMFNGDTHTGGGGVGKDMINGRGTGGSRYRHDAEWFGDQMKLQRPSAVLSTDGVVIISYFPSEPFCALINSPSGRSYSLPCASCPSATASRPRSYAPR